MPLAGRVACRSTLATLHDPDPKVNALLQRYHFPAEPFPWRLRQLDANEHYTVYHLTFPSPRQYDLSEANTVHAEYYLPRQVKGKAPAVVVLDILDGSYKVARLVCRGFATAGIPGLIVKMPYYGERRPPNTTLAQVFVGRPERMLQVIEGTVVDVRRAACWLQSRREVDPRRIGIVGTSLGGIVGALAVGVDPRFNRNVLIIAGGDPAGVLWHAPETRRVRDRMAELGMTLESLRAESRAIDPVTFARRADPKSILMINASKDETIPRESTVALWEAFGKPAIQWYPAGHYTIALFIPAILPSAAQFILSAP
jgi:dienelactone hydrolase